MFNNNSCPPTGNNNNNNNNNNKKRKPRKLPVPTEEERSGRKKRQNVPQPANLPLMGPAQPVFGFGNPQMTNPAYAPMSTPYAGSQPGVLPSAMDSAAFVTQYPQLQAQFQPQPQYSQQQPQHVSQLGVYNTGPNMQPPPGFPNLGLIAGQQQATSRARAQGQETLICVNCSRGDHLVGDCVGPPNVTHGDLPACPICDKFDGCLDDATGLSGHQFDDCHHVLGVLYRHQWEKGRRMAYEDLADLMNDELYMFWYALVVKRLRKAPIRTKLVCWIDVLRETTRRFPNSHAINSLGNMRPWTKAFAIQQRSLGARMVKPWEFYDYAAGNILTLPACPVEQVETAGEDLVADGLPRFPPQVFIGSDRLQPGENTDIAADGSPWREAVRSTYQYLVGLSPVSSDSYGHGFKGVDRERLIRPLSYDLCREERRDRFTAFLEAGADPDSWFCVEQICSIGHNETKPVDSRCLLHYGNDDCCPLQVRHLDASSGGRTLDFRVPNPTEVEEDEDEEDGAVKITTGAM